MLHWELVPSDSGLTVYRAQVPGGWLVFTYWGSGYAGQTFYHACAPSERCVAARRH